MTPTGKDLSYYLGLPYTRRTRVERDKGGEYFVAYVEELSGLESDGVTEAEAWYNLHRAFVDYIASLLDRNVEIAEPELWPGTPVASRVLSWGSVFKKVFVRKPPSEIEVAVSRESVVINAPEEWSQPETEVRTSGSLAGV